MDRIGTANTRLVVLRGNSGSGKSTLATSLRERFESGAALVQQDYLRRVVLSERETATADNIALIDEITRFCLSRGRNVILEGIFNVSRYGKMLEQLASDHVGRTSFFAYDLTFEETLARHQTRPQAAEFGEDEMRSWYHGWQPLPYVREARLLSTMSVNTAADAVIHELESAETAR